ncbi:hypothetical protein PSDVSF_28040 [Pseudodesulfovibrio sediminis]|uniref:Uncharacterized protein n=1 Tax=Pseudodesulfovibrio sediminis TaxID=2810563 RepID=A0ABM7P989_9BACT|nr:hypothetical protein PSDVSF_28040 [Pseudodesulfovibrio sediminis]
MKAPVPCDGPWEAFNEETSHFAQEGRLVGNVDDTVSGRCQIVEVLYQSIIIRPG